MKREREISFFTVKHICPTVSAYSLVMAEMSVLLAIIIVFFLFTFIISQAYTCWHIYISLNLR